MNILNDLCKLVENIDMESYQSLLKEKSDKIIPALYALNSNGAEVVYQYSLFIIGAVIADGKISNEEYALTEPLLKAFFGETIDYEKVSKLLNGLKDEAKEIKENVDQIIDAYGSLSDELKQDMIIVCLLICGVDHKVSNKEKKWIKQLIK